MQRAIRVYKLNDLNGRIDSLRGFINIGNYNFSSDMGYLHISGTTSNYIFNFPEKRELWDKDSANVFWSNWRHYLLTSYSADSLANLIRVRKIPENKEIFNFRIAKAAKYMITKNDEYIYAEVTNGTPGASIGWIKYKLSDGLFDNSFKYSDTLYGARSKAMFIRNDNHIFIYSSAAINPEFWIRNANDGSVIYYNKCNINASIRSVSFNDNYQQFTLTFSDGSLSTYKLPDGILDVNEEITTNNEISISPNPARDYIEISLDSPSIKRGLGGVSFEIFNIFGEKISTPSLLRNATPQEGNIKIDISNVAPGVYFIKIGDKFEKFVKW